MDRTLSNFFGTLLLCVCFFANALAQCPEDVDFTNTSVQDCLGSFAFTGQLCPTDQIFIELEDNILVPPASEISWYIDTDSNVDFVDANFIGTSAITTNPTAVSPCMPCPELLGIMVDACQDVQNGVDIGPEPNNEFVVIGSGGGFNTSELTLDYMNGNNFEPGGTPPGSNQDISPTGPCNLKFPEPIILSNILQSVNCVDVNPAGPNTDIPAGAVFIIFTSNFAAPFYNFDALCANGAPIYVAQSTCGRTIGAFTNGSDSGLRTTILDIDCGCQSSITHDTGNDILMAIPPTTGGGIVYYNINNDLVYELTNCQAPPVNLIPLPAITSNTDDFSYTVTAADCGNTLTIQGVISPTFDGCTEAVTPTFQFTVNCTEPDLGDAEICVGETLDLTGLLDPNYTSGVWLGPSGSPISEFEPSSTGDQDLTFVSFDCCVVPSSTTITVTSGTTVMAIPDTLLCPGQSEIDLDGLILDSSLPAGTWNGVGVNGNIFDPAGFQDEIVVVTFDPEECGPFTNVNITIAEAPEEMFTQTICRSDSVTINGEIYNFDRPTDTQFLTANVGCDTAFNIMLDFYDQPESTFIDSICSGLDLMVGDSTFNESKLTGTVIFSGASADGCDSLVNVALTIMAAPPAVMFTQAICPGDSIEIAGIFYNQDLLTGSETIQAANGCDSTINVSLQLIADAVNNVRFSLCADRDTMINSVMYSESNATGRDTIQNAAINGCDSILIINIDFINESMGLPVEETICTGDEFELIIGDQVFDETNPSGFGILTASNGCDSIIPVDLVVLQTISGPIYTESFCAGSTESVIFGTDTFDQNNPSGMATISASNGCDSVFQVDLTYAGDINGVDFETTECSGSDFEITFGGQTFNQGNPSGIATEQTAEGCDSTFNVTINFEPSITGDDFFRQTCIGSGLEFNLGGIIFNEANPSGIATEQTTDGCDSTYQVNLIFSSGVSGPDYTDADCVGGPLEVTFGTQIFNEANPTGTATITSAAGCDSTFNVILTFQDEVQGPDFTDSDCVGGPLEVVFGSQTFNEANPTGTATIASAAGCDSTFNVILTFQDEVQGPDFTDSDCVGGPLEVVFGTQTFNEANPTGTATIASAAGCDSTFNVILTFQDEVQGPDFTDSDCVGGPLEVTFGAQTFNEANPTGTATIASASGCDSTFNVILTFQDEVQGPDFTDSDCFGGPLEVVFGSQIFNEANPTGTATIASASGCDSTFNVILTFQDEVQGPDFTDSDCFGGPLEVVFGSQTFNEANPTGTATIVSASGCDSTFNVILTFQDEVQGPDFTDSDCVGGPLEVVFGSQTFNEANPTGTATIASASGCDSTFNVILTFQDEVQGPDFTDSDCVGGPLEVVFGFQTFNEANPTGTATISSAAGCDSTFNVILTFQDIIQGPDFISSECEGSNFAVTFGTDIFNESNPTGIATIQSAAGCDSTFLVSLSFGQASSSSIIENYCSGEDASIIVGTQVFNEANPTGSVVLQNQNAVGCDSTVNINLSFDNFTLDLIGDEDICRGDMATFTIVTNSTDTFDLTLANFSGELALFTDLQNGSQISLTPQTSNTYFTSEILGVDCIEDFSTNTFNIEVSELEVELIPLNTNGGAIDCTDEGNGAIEALVNGADGMITYQWNQGGQTNTIENLTSGEYNVVVTDESGCTDSENIELVNGSPIEIDFTLDPTGCDGSDGMLSIQDIQGGSSNQYSIIVDGEFSPLSSPIFPVVFSLEAGEHEVSIVDEFGCSILEEFEVISTDPGDLALIVTEDQSLESGSSVPLSVMGNFPLDSIVWSPALSLSCENCKNPIAQPAITTTYTVTGFDNRGCSVSAEIVLRVDRNSSIYIPNIFSPNDDGFNDLFYVFGGAEVAMVNELSILDRWGNQVFFVENAPANNAQFGWDGEFRGEKMQPDVFVYFGVVELIDGTLIDVEGNITLIK